MKVIEVVRKYVDDLTKVKPEEIQNVDHPQPVQAIVHCPDVNKPDREIVIVYSDGKVCRYTRDGRAWEEWEQKFVYRRKVKTLTSYVNWYSNGMPWAFSTLEAAEASDGFNSGSEGGYIRRVAGPVEVTAEIEVGEV